MGHRDELLLERGVEPSVHRPSVLRRKHRLIGCVDEAKAALVARVLLVHRVRLRAEAADSPRVESLAVGDLRDQ